MAALVAGGVGAVALLGNRGGAGSAAEAVTLLSQDLGSQDYLSAFGRLHPAEAGLFTDVGDLVVGELQRLDVLRPDADLGSTAGGTTVTDLRFDEAAAEQVRPDVVITKLVGGTITTDGDPADIPFTDSFRALAFPEGLPPAEGPMTVDIAQVVAEQGEPIRLAAVEVDGSWYVSLFYTAADYALRDEGLTWPQQSVAPRGAATPQDALRETAQAVLDQDARRIVELAPPGELSVLHDVGEALIADAGGTPSGARIVELETDDVQVRGRPALFITRVVVEDPGGERLTIVRDGDCVTLEAAGSPQRLCAADLAQAGGLPIDDPLLAPVADLVPDIVQVLLEVKVVTTEVDGLHHVSPVRTVVGLYGDLFAVIDREDVAALFAAAR
ncbi:flagellar basal body protein FliL [Pseudonocardia sp.]|uniref:flagellar basal body protein FliL n=1 Tax=Pseudonocardia sp. TaxID=60912 RepID=UPI00261E38F0|nr:flagellar basal body protein FliL [Pseudonocardia sp.]